MSNYADEIWLISIESPGYPPWLIYVKDVGGHAALASELKSILESRPIEIPFGKDYALRVYCGIQIEPWIPKSARQLYKERDNALEETPVAEVAT